MTKLVDLTQPWGDRMPTWPQFEAIQVTDITTHHRDGKSTVLVRTRYFRPDLVKEYEAQTGKPIDETLPMKDFEHVHYHMAKANIPMLENLGGEMAEVAGRRVEVGAFPWRWVNGEGCICRVVAFQP